MTLVDTTTGELVEFDRAAAERRAERITLRLESIADNTEAVKGMIREAIEKRDDMALGYRSLGEYVSDRFGGSLGRLGIEVRRAFVAELTEAGMSTRAIAPVVGVDHATVSRDRSRVAPATPDQTPAPAEHRAAGSGQTPQGEAAPDSGRTAPVEGSQEGAVDAPRPVVTGIDGKTYTRPEPKPTPKPVLVGDAADYDNAEKACLYLSRAISKLLEFQYPNMRNEMRRHWSMASTEVPPTPRRDVTPEQMRAAAQGLLALADEWDAR